MAEEEVVDPAVGQEPVEVEDPLPGAGKFQFPDGSWYEGDYITVNRKKKRHGMGMLQDGPESYEGAWVNDSMTGEGQYTFSSGATYTGSFKNGEFEQSYCGVFISNMSQIGTNAAVACFTAFGE